MDLAGVRQPAPAARGFRCNFSHLAPESLNCARGPMARGPRPADRAARTADGASRATDGMRPDLERARARRIAASGGRTDLRGQRLAICPAEHNAPLCPAEHNGPRATGHGHRTGDRGRRATDPRQRATAHGPRHAENGHRAGGRGPRATAPGRSQAGERARAGGLFNGAGRRTQKSPAGSGGAIGRG